jgi:hypothetical protein
MNEHTPTFRKALIALEFKAQSQCLKNEASTMHLHVRFHAAFSLYQLAQDTEKAFSSNFAFFKIASKFS